MSYLIKCPKCNKGGGCICHKWQFWNRFFGKYIDVLCHYCGYEWIMRKNKI